MEDQFTDFRTLAAQIGCRTESLIAVADRLQDIARMTGSERLDSLVHNVRGHLRAVSHYLWVACKNLPSPAQQALDREALVVGLPLPRATT